MRINARLDDEYALKLNYLQRQTEKSVTEIIKLALDAYYQEYAQQHPIDLLTESGFIGCGEAESNLSTHYKLDYADSLEEKYGLTQ
ncbi:CopG family transcriptional regulator [Acaryochloris sp. 'Moss Beach']|uniref:ribbon-helix-helix domain-containing protein n=1 Tax=Acaryochloris sp. 'Moss Beach' TaxID=2740837 RepID=UPI001F234A5D|nr:ribbon-helix-helix domain-containing protein [Acaryochloris sp. 'Moss Beach']UJB68736.1 CopG family transcriptional regulator [Acaryochloris sp. 'Moss Beach']